MLTTFDFNNALVNTKINMNYTVTQKSAEAGCLKLLSLPNFFFVTVRH